MENGNIKIIEGYVCTQDAPIRTVNYEFTTQTSGDYELRFKSNDTNYITVNLSIE